MIGLKYKKMRFLVITILILSFKLGSSQIWKRAETIKGAGNDYATGLATDSYGNVYVSGRVKFQATFGAGSNAQSPPQYQFETDAFIAKYDSSFNLKWVQRMGGKMPDWGHDIRVDSLGNVYTIGDFCDTANFGGKTLVGYGPDPGGDPFKAVRNTYMAKFDSIGNIKWVKHIGGVQSHTRGYDIELDDEGFVYGSGYATGVVNYAGVTLGEKDKGVAFVIKMDTAGNVIWVKEFKAKYGAGISDMIFYKKHIYVTGGFKGDLLVDSIKYAGENPTWEDVFITKLDLNGIEVKTTTSWGRFRDNGKALAIFRDELYLAGTFANDLSFNNVDTIYSQVISTSATQALSSENGFLMKLDLDLNQYWLKAFGGNKSMIIEDLEVLNGENVLISGETNDSVLFAGAMRVTNGSKIDPFMAIFDSKGNEKGWIVGGANFNEHGYQIAPYFGDVIYSGAIYPNAILGNIVLGTAGGWDAFFAQISLPYSLEFDEATPNCVDSLPISIEATPYFSGFIDSISWTFNGSSYNRYSEFRSSFTGPGGNYDLRFQGFNQDSLVLDSNLSEYFQVGIYPVLELPKDTVVCDQTMLVISPIGGRNYNFYKWSIGSSDSSISVSSAGKYWVKVSNDDICYSADTMEVKIDVCQGMDDENLEQTIRYYPNPLTDILNISSSSSFRRVVIRNASGQIMNITEVDANSSQIMVSEFGAGLYLVSVEFDDCVHHKKVLKR